MKRLFAVALVVTMANASTAFAGESLLSVGTRHVQQIAVSEPAAPAAQAEAPKGAKPAAAYQGQGEVISQCAPNAPGAGRHAVEERDGQGQEGDAVHRSRRRVRRGRLHDRPERARRHPLQPGHPTGLVKLVNG